MKASAARTYRKLLYWLSEFEASGLRPGQRSPWRKRFLKARGVRHGVPFYLGRGFWLHYGWNFTFGNRCSLGEYAQIMDHGPITIGNDFMAATGLHINSGTHDPETLASIVKPVTIGDRVWCGANVTITAGVEIGDDVVIGACSLVRTSVPSGTIVAGVPAREIRKLNRKEPPPSWWPDWS